jgi:hypothetical protein
MRVIVDLPRGDSPVVVRAAQHLLESVYELNVDFLTRIGSKFPWLYNTNVRFRPEPFKDGEHFDPIWIVVKRGWGDCDDLCSWRRAELKVRCGEDTTSRIVWPTQTRKYHALVRRADGTWEDPSLVMLRKEHLGR